MQELAPSQYRPFANSFAATVRGSSSIQTNYSVTLQRSFDTTLSIVYLPRLGATRQLVDHRPYEHPPRTEATNDTSERRGPPRTPNSPHLRVAFDDADSVWSIPIFTSTLMTRIPLVALLRPDSLLNKLAQPQSGCISAYTRRLGVGRKRADSGRPPKRIGGGCTEHMDCQGFPMVCRYNMHRGSG